MKKELRIDEVEAGDRLFSVRHIKALDGWFWSDRFDVVEGVVKSVKRDVYVPSRLIFGTVRRPMQVMSIRLKGGLSMLNITSEDWESLYCSVFTDRKSAEAFATKMNMENRLWKWEHYCLARLHRGRNYKYISTCGK